MAFQSEGGGISVLLALLLGALLCPHVLSLPGGTTRPDIVTQGDRDNRNSVDTLSLARSNADFAFSLYKLLAAQNPDANVIFSPLSVSMALAFLALGARGHTQTEMLQGLKFNLTETPEADIHRGYQMLRTLLSRPGTALQLNMSTAMFLDQQLELQERFQQDARALYAADAISTDFQDPNAAKKLINDYVEQKTEGKIRDLITDLDTHTKMVLVNCLFFKAKWKMPFDPHDTFVSDFHVSESKKVKVPMMAAENIRVPYFRDETLGCTVVQLPYTDSSAYALLILPDKGHMSQVEAALLPGTLQRWRDSVKTRNIDLYLPKFSISGDFDLKQVLPRLGISSIFSRQADFLGFTQALNLTVSQVVHKAVLDVAEEGTEAAAATGIKLVLTSAHLVFETVKFNKPFLVAISEDTKTILFLGKVANPKQAELPLE